MELKNRSFRVTDETVDRLKSVADEVGDKMYVVLAAAIHHFDPVKNSEHAAVLARTRLTFEASDIAALIDAMPPEMKEALINKLKVTE